MAHVFFSIFFSSHVGYKIPAYLNLFLWIMILLSPWIFQNKAIDSICCSAQTLGVHNSKELLPPFQLSHHPKYIFIFQTLKLSFICSSLVVTVFACRVLECCSTGFSSLCNLLALVIFLLQAVYYIIKMCVLLKSFYKILTFGANFDCVSFHMDMQYVSLDWLIQGILILLEVWLDISVSNLLRPFIVPKHIIPSQDMLFSHEQKWIS